MRSLDSDNWNSGNVNTGFGISTDSGAVNSGFGNTGTETSGFFNSATGGAIVNGQNSGFFNVGIPGSLVGPGSSGQISGLLNFGTLLSGLFSLSRLLP
ncbi:hypothetical protein [Mycobacterium sp. 1081908.1]|uniref:hypothetical protein n=1 Tax=Mycobacterium sp. 1081908.1 TaxID=1834066 RepID=UPI000800B2CB|nr:hypothetical protein A5655_04410 [Mycobacterium sp. 1081908.1]